MYSALDSGSAVCAGGASKSLVEDGDVDVLQPAVQARQIPVVSDSRRRNMLMQDFPWSIGSRGSIIPQRERREARQDGQVITRARSGMQTGGDVLLDGAVAFE